jgi:hypothetical protein
MHTIDLAELMKGFRSVELGSATPSALHGLLADIRRVRAQFDLIEVEVFRRLGESSATPERDVARAARRPDRYGSKVKARAGIVGSTPSLAAALETGSLAGDHVDVYLKVLGSQDPKVREGLEAIAPELVGAAIRNEATPEEFAAQLNTAADRIAGDLGIARFERQRRATRLRTWTNRVTGMWHLSGCFDPLSGAELHGRLQASMAAMFAKGVPSTAPKDPGERQDHLRALALLAMTARQPAAAKPGPAAGTTAETPRPFSSSETSPGSEPRAGDGWAGDSWAGDGRAGSHDGPPSGTDEWDLFGESLGGRTARFGKPELVVVINADSLDADGRPIVDVGLPVKVPWEKVAGLVRRARVHPVVVNRGNVVAAEGELNLGRSSRIASRAQRRALTALYSTCATPDCGVHVQYTKPHHLWWWRHGGPTDLWNLCPLCHRCHDNVHHRGWILTMGPNRELTVELPDGTTMKTGPPSRTEAA